MGNKYIVPFNMSEEEIRKNFLDWIIIGDNTPIDIAYKATITSVEKSFYPFRGVHAAYEADWSALSIWETEEEYEEQVPMIRYRMTFNGYTSKCSRTEYERMPCHDGVEIIDKFYETQTKKRTVIADQRVTNGIINGTYYKKIITTENNDAGFIEWLDSIPTEEKTDYSEKMANGIQLKELVNTDEYVENQIAPDIKNKATKECEKAVPGSRFEEFSVNDLSVRFDVDIYHVPAYDVSYEYNGNHYTVTMSGSVKDSAYASNKPVDSDLAEKKRVMYEKLEALKKTRFKCGLLGFLLPLILMILTLAIDIGDFQTFMFFGDILLAVVLIKFKFLPSHKEVKNQNNVIQVHLNNLSDKRKEILSIVNNDALTEEEQKAQIKKAIEG